MPHPEVRAFGGKKFSEVFVNLGSVEALFYWGFEVDKVDKKTRKVDRNDVFDVACQPNVNPLSTLDAILSTKCQPKCNPDAALSARSGELTEGIVGGAHVDFASLPSKHVSSETRTFASVTAPARLERYINHH